MLVTLRHCTHGRSQDLPESLDPILVVSNGWFVLNRVAEDLKQQRPRLVDVPRSVMFAHVVDSGLKRAPHLIVSAGYSDRERFCTLEHFLRDLSHGDHARRRRRQFSPE